jgi:hypothetical protein
MGLTKKISYQPADFGEIIGESTVFTENLPFGRSSTIGNTENSLIITADSSLSPRI